MRTLQDHIVPGAAGDVIKVQVLDEPGSGGACHQYVLGVPGVGDTHIQFQNGPIAEAGINGLTNEALLVVLIDRMRGFQSGKFACRENAVALTNLEQALMWLQKRTRERLLRGVEGTHTS